MNDKPDRPADLQQLLDCVLGLRNDGESGSLDRLRDQILGAVKSRMARGDTLRSALDSEDLTQETLFEIVRNLRYFRGTTWGEFHAFLDAVLVRRKADLARHHQRLRRRGPSTPLDVHDLDVPSAGPSPASSVTASEDLTRLRGLVDHLPPECAIVIHLRMDGLDHSAIAQRLSISEVAARKRLSRAIAELRRMWNDASQG